MGFAALEIQAQREYPLARASHIEYITPPLNKTDNPTLPILWEIVNQENIHLRNFYFSDFPFIRKLEKLIMLFCWGA